MIGNEPTSSYIVWHTQRTGSTLLCMALEATGIAGIPHEWPESGVDFLRRFADSESARAHLWENQTTTNGVLGAKISYHQPVIDALFSAFETDTDRTEKKDVWDWVFPNCKHIVMTRRDKLRLAVSWWKSICGSPYHLSLDGRLLPWKKSVEAVPEDIEDRYDYNAIDALIAEAETREQGIYALLAEIEVEPLILTYEEFMQSYEESVLSVLKFIGVDSASVEITPPLLAKTSDRINEVWVKKFEADQRAQ